MGSFLPSDNINGDSQDTITHFREQSTVFTSIFLTTSKLKNEFVKIEERNSKLTNKCVKIKKKIFSKLKNKFVQIDKNYFSKWILIVEKDKWIIVQNHLDQTFSPRCRTFVFSLCWFPSAVLTQVLKKLASADHRSRKQEWSMDQFVREMTTNNLSQSPAKKVTRPTYIDKRQQFSNLQMLVMSHLQAQFVVEYGVVIPLDLFLVV